MNIIFEYFDLNKRAKQSRISLKETDWGGNEKEVHYEDDRKVGETKCRETFWGDKVQDHYDASGNKIGETRKEEGFFGDKAVHYDSDGNKVGYSKEDTTLFGNKIQRHYDKGGKEVGKSKYEEGFLGDKIVHSDSHEKKANTSDDNQSRVSSSPITSDSTKNNNVGRRVIIKKSDKGVIIPDSSTNVPAEQSNAHISLCEQLLLYSGTVIGVLFSSYVSHFKDGKISSLSFTMSSFFVSAVIALVIIPVAYEKINVKREAPLLVRFALFVQHGVFWQVLFGFIGKAIIQ